MICIIGKIGDDTLEGVKAKFQEAENSLHELGLKVNNPMKMGFTTNWTSKEQLEKRMDVIRKQASAIYLLRDWKDDMNAKREFAEAAHLNTKRANKIRIYFEESGGLRDLKTDIEDEVLTINTQVS